MEAAVLGKPSLEFFDAALNDLNSRLGVALRSDEVLMVGDDVRDDVIGAQRAGMKGMNSHAHKNPIAIDHDSSCCLGYFVDE